MLTASDTAYAMATFRAMEAELPEADRLFADPYAQIFAAAGAHAREGTERFVSSPFMRDGIRLRTRHIDDVARAALARGTRQLVLMGAGFDSRTLRLPEAREHDVQSFEIDFPALLDTKRSLLEKADISLPARVRYLACDFMADFEAPLLDALLANGFDRARPAFFLWEGVTAYIGLDAIERCLRFMASISAPGSQVIFDYSSYLFDRAKATELTRRAGFTAFDEIAFDELWRRHLQGEPPPPASVIRLGIGTK